MSGRLYLNLSQNALGFEKGSSILEILDNNLLHVSFNITVINKGRKQMLKTWPAATVCSSVPLFHTFSANAKLVHKLLHSDILC